MSGIVYILVNQAMPEYVKLGKTETSVEQRMRELSRHSGVPLPFECYYAARVNDADFVERQLHDAFDDHRPNKSREFFTISPERLASALKIAELEDVTPRMDIVESEDDRQALNKAREQRSRFNFKMVDVPQGTILHFVKNDSITATVVDHRNVEMKGEIMSLTAAALKNLNAMGYDWKQVQGPAYWLIDGETLVERRYRMENE